MPRHGCNCIYHKGLLRSWPGVRSHKQERQDSSWYMPKFNPVPAKSGPAKYSSNELHGFSRCVSALTGESHIQAAYGINMNARCVQRIADEGVDSPLSSTVPSCTASQAPRSIISRRSRHTTRDLFRSQTGRLTTLGHFCSTAELPQLYTAPASKMTNRENP